ncbi:unnamed protein product [Parascedosporium putredinis]|uniref:RecA family profile 1 domain-containing protein n=1 Tax=Parascedosporium putredinis TaxID=1442378 RepID=A0A9P1H2I5_9PEZI|nr:unnamed protein product [Parascedosporium putredinis]CAI7995008.1 unnamed protein product [Parascedosporium putredinis]
MSSFKNRLPAVSAAQALDDLNDDPSQFVSTGLGSLDRALTATPESLRDQQQDGSGDRAENHVGNGSGPPGAPSGLCRGQVTEIWGPPGVGKTAMGIQIAASALSDGRGVVWRFAHVVEAARIKGRPEQILGRGASDGQRRQQSGLEREEEEHADGDEDGAPGEKAEHETDTEANAFVHYTSLLNEAFPKAPDGRNLKSSKASGLSTRRLQTVQYVIGALQKLAATRNCAVVLLSQCVTKMQSQNRGAALMPSISAGVWEQGLTTRIALFRDWMWKDGIPIDTRFVGIQRLAGKAIPGSGIQKVAAFRVESFGLAEVEFDEAEQQREQLRAGNGRSQTKRKLGVTRQEVPDSDEEYGWDSDDNAHLPPEPPQWQGSEDLIIGTQRSLDGEETEGDGDAELETDEGPEDGQATTEKRGYSGVSR